VVSDRDERLAAHLGTSLPSERAAAERNWRSLSTAIVTPARSRFGALRVALSAAALVVLVIGGLGWWEGERLDVASGRFPVLYREEVGRTSIAAAGIDATLAITQKHIEGDSRLRVVGVTDVRVGTDRLPATIELRFQAVGDDSYGVLAHSEVTDPRRATGTTRTLYEAPFPPLGPRERATYRVWLHIETASGAIDSDQLGIDVTDRPEGQRASLGVSR
jgi:hypothetical protein